MFPKLKCLLLLTVIVLVHLFQPTAAQDDPSIALLRQEKVKQSGSAKPGAAAQNFAPLTDGKTDRMLEILLQPGNPLDILYHLPAVATCQQLVISADTRKLSKNQLPRIEILVSTLSDQAGFQSTRSLALKATADSQQLKIPPAAAQWVIVRIVSPLESATLRIAEIDIQGYPGLPQTRYAFKEAPAKAFQVLAAVQKSVAVKITQDEASLFEDTADGKLDDWSLAEAALLSSGVLDAEKRKQYLAQIDRITEKAKVAVKNGKTPYEKGERLLKWLHAHPMANGYESQQTDLSVILDTGKFNCVSSATLFNIVGRRLGLDVRAIEVPDHAFSIQYAGTHHADVETTNAAGFNPARDPRVLKQFTQQTGFNYIPDRHADKRREVTNIGLLALTCYNHAVAHSEKKQHAEALADFFRALNLDPEFPSAIRAVLGTLGSWSGELIAQEHFEQALEVISVGLRLAPEDYRFRHNRKAVWQAWAIKEIKNNRRQQGLEIFKRAAKAVPGAGFEKMQALAYTYAGDQRVEAKQWEAALELAEEGLKTLPPLAQKELRRWRNSLYNHWTVITLNQKDYPAAADILEQAMMADPKERDFTRNTAFLVQQWLAATHAKQGLAEAESLVNRLFSRFKSIDDVHSVIETFLTRTTITLLKANQFKEAASLIDRHQKQLSERSFLDLHRGVYDEQAKKLRNQKQWEESIAIYTRALKKFPADRQLTQNLGFTCKSWAAVHQKATDWSAAAEVYLKALDSGFDKREMEKRIGYCVAQLAIGSWKSEGTETAEKHLSEWSAKRPELETLRTGAGDYVRTLIQKHQQDKQPEKALTAVDRCRKLLTTRDHERFIRYVCDQWAQSHLKKGNPDEALAVYQLGFKSLPGDRHMTQNGADIWNQQGLLLIKQKQWVAAIKLYQEGLKQFPKSSSLRTNLKYSQQEANR